MGRITDYTFQPQNHLVEFQHLVENILLETYGLLFAMAPTRNQYTMPQVARLPRLELDAACEAWGIEVPRRALDLEKRAMLARKITGGAPCCLKCSACSPEQQVAELLASKIQLPWRSLSPQCFYWRRFRSDPNGQKESTGDLSLNLNLSECRVSVTASAYRRFNSIYLNLPSKIRGGNNRILHMK